jgi:hypothetical protein
MSDKGLVIKDQISGICEFDSVISGAFITQVGGSQSEVDLGEGLLEGN